MAAGRSRDVKTRGTLRSEPDMILAHAFPDSGRQLHDLVNAWTLDPLVIVPLALVGFLYLKGSRLQLLWSSGSPRRLNIWQAVSFAAGMVALFFALVWPLDRLGEELFSGHMAQHMVLMNIAAPLLVLGAPLPVMFRALPVILRRALGLLLRHKMWRAGWRMITGIVTATVLQQLILWSWHTPRGIAAALEGEAVHVAMHASLLASALFFWTAVLQPNGRNWWSSIAALVATLKITGLVCIVMMLRESAVYAAYGDSALAWGFTPAQDEQLGWGVMMVVGTVTYLGAAVAAAAVALERLEKTPG